MSLRAPISYQQRGSLVNTVGPAIEPISAAQLRTHLRATSTSFPDVDADQVITESREMIERITGITMVNQSWKLTLDQWPTGQDQWWDGTRTGATTELNGSSGGIITFPTSPLVSVTSVNVFASDGTSTAVTIATTFVIDTYSTPGRMALASGQTWPVLGLPINAIEIVYVSGYGANGETLPAPIYRAVLQCAAYLYSHRGDGCDVSTAYRASGAEQLVGLYDVKHI